VVNNDSMQSLYMLTGGRGGGGGGGGGGRGRLLTAVDFLAHDAV